jgi:hypothetical protein
MFGLLILAAFWGYVFFSIAVVKRTKRWARATGRSATRWGWGAGVAMYLLVFWDLIPFYLVRHHYCAKEAGLVVYQTLAQWKAANPGWTVPEPIHYPGQAKNIGKGLFYLNTRFRVEVTRVKSVFPLLPLGRSVRSLVDVETGSVMAKLVTFYGTGNLRSANSWADYKLWMQIKSCGAAVDSATDSFRILSNEFGQLGREAGHGR